MRLSDEMRLLDETERVSQDGRHGVVRGNAAAVRCPDISDTTIRYDY